MLIKVLNTRTVFGDKAAVLKTVMSDEKKEHFLYRIFGTVEAKTTGKGRFKRVDKETGEAVDTYWTKFYGEFYAVNVRKEEYSAATCFIPSYVEGQFAEQLENGVTEIGFAFDVYAIYDASVATSYQYIVVPVKSGDEKSKAELMREQMPALPTEKQKALPKSK